MWDDAWDLFASTAEVRGLLDQAQMRVLYDRHQSGVARNSYVLGAWVLERWLRLRRVHAQTRRVPRNGRSCSRITRCLIPPR